ncbi:MAG: hypothetical protein EOO15_09870 [Chitinophagaceae bacterium]|nr:MAG: hypothetical protein EOO15_09870 [Chitinophagaceae bacterium]
MKGPSSSCSPILPIWEQGVLLAQRSAGFHTLRLYQLEDHYIEVTVHNHFNVVLRVATFRDTAHLEPYLSDVDISGLFA